MQWSLILLIFLAFFIRLINLNQSLWLDEATTAKVVRNYSIPQIITQFSPYDFHPPFYYFFMKGWTTVFGVSEIALRFPSIIFSLLTAYVIYLIGKRWYGEKVGWWSAALFLFNPLIVYYSQEARMYMMVTFFLTCCLYYFLKIIYGKQSFGDVILFDVFIFLSVMTFYGAIFFILALLVFAFRNPKLQFPKSKQMTNKKFQILNYIVLYLKKLNFEFVSDLGFRILNLLTKKYVKKGLMLYPSLVVGLLLLSPLLYQQWQHSRESLRLVSNWSNILGKANLKNSLLIPIKFSLGRISFYPKEFYYLIAGVWTLFVISYLLLAARKERGLFFLFIFPIIFGLLFSFFTPLLQYFRFLYLLPLFSLLLSLGAQKSKTASFMLTGFIVFSLFYLLNSRFHREDWKSLVRSLPKKTKVYMILPSSDPISYYRQDVFLEELRSIEKAGGTEKEILIIPYTAEIYGFDYKKFLEKESYILSKTTSFRELTIERWVEND